MISQADKVVSYFGYWPEFCDGKIEVFSYEAPTTILMGITYIDSEQSKSAHVLLRFSGVSEVSLNEIRSENVIDSLHIANNSPASVSIESCYGLGGTFNYQTAEVVSVQPNNSFQG